jgi:phage terminase large subunit-like protein
MPPTKRRSTAKPRSSTTSSRTRPKRVTNGFSVIRWIETHCVCTQGEWIGKPLRLLPWQKRLILELFTVRPDGLRLYRWALWGVPKKNGKTELAAALGLYFLIGSGEPSPLVVCSAASDEQADLVFGAAKRMCELSPTLSQITECWEKEITVPSIIGAVLKRVAAVAGTNDGQNIYVVICDELHEWMGAEEDTTGRKGRDCWTVLTNGTGARRQPLVLQITTAGYDPRTVCHEQYEYCKKVESGEIEDERYHFFWIEAPKEADYKDPAVWKAANPSYGVTVHPDFFEDQVKKKPENVFRRYFLNQWTGAQSAWLPAGAWAGCEETGVKIPLGSDVYLGVDVGIKKDTSAIDALWLREDGKVVVKAEIFTPPGDGSALELATLEQRIRQLADDFVVRGVVYDRWTFERSAQQLSDEGLLMIEFPMTNERTVPASSRLYEAIVGGRIVHDGDPVLAAHVAAGATKETERGWRLSKSKPKRAIDALIALMIGLPSVEQGAGKTEAMWF